MVKFKWQAKFVDALPFAVVEGEVVESEEGEDVACAAGVGVACAASDAKHAAETQYPALHARPDRQSC
jgi:hypothetical protein